MGNRILFRFGGHLGSLFFCPQCFRCNFWSRHAQRLVDPSFWSRDQDASIWTLFTFFHNTDFYPQLKTFWVFWPSVTEIHRLQKKANISEPDTSAFTKTCFWAQPIPNTPLEPTFRLADPPWFKKIGISTTEIVFFVQTSFRRWHGGT